MSFTTIKNVFVSAVTQDNISRHELLAWVNSTIKANFSKIEEMSTGAAYCQLTHLLFRNGISLRKVKWNSRNELDHINNWNILRTAWENLGVKKPVHVDRLMKAKFQDNFEFLQWFYKFFNANYKDDGKEYDAVAARGGEPLPTEAKKTEPARTVPHRNQKTKTAQAFIPSTVKKGPQNPNPSCSNRSKIADESTLKSLEEKNAELFQRNEKMTIMYERLVNETKSYCEKLREIENLCNAWEKDDGNLRESVLAVIYAANDAKGGQEVISQAVNVDDETYSAIFVL